jgi:hypothetical protein
MLFLNRNLKFARPSLNHCQVSFMADLKKGGKEWGRSQATHELCCNPHCTPSLAVVYK